jgi:peptide/nickel transport system substrate-binding protein
VIAVIIVVILAGVAVYMFYPRAATPSVITYATSSEMTTLDPSSEFSNSILLLPNVYETLTKWNPTASRADPLLATTWSVSTDGITWTYTLRQGVKFHDGTPLNATAVKFSIERTVYMNQGAAYIWYPLKGASAFWAASAAEKDQAWANFTSQAVQIIDTYHVQFTLDYPAALDRIASSGYGAYIFSPTTPGANYTLQQTWFNVGHHDSGSGPYVINSTQYSQSYAVLDKFADYWGGWGAGTFDHAIIKLIADQAQREQAVVSGTADITIDVPLQDLPALRSNTAVRVEQNPSYRALYAFFNMQRSPTDNLSVRQALAYSIPYDDIVSTAVAGLGSQSIGVVPATMWGHDDTLPHYTFNLTKAQELLTAAGYPSGGFTLSYTYLQGDLYEQSVAGLWKEKLATLGITLDIQPMPWEQQWALAQSNPATAQSIFVMYWWPTYVTPYDFLYNMFSSASYQYFNLGYYSNSTFDDTINTASALEATDPTQALTDYRAAQVMLYNDCPGLGFVDLKNLYVMKSGLQGFADNPAYPLVVFFYQLHH